MIKLEVHKDKENHFLISANEPIRIEIQRIEKENVLAYVYKGVEIDLEQEPCIVYDGTIEENKNITL